MESLLLINIIEQIKSGRKDDKDSIVKFLISFTIKIDAWTVFKWMASSHVILACYGIYTFNTKGNLLSYNLGQDFTASFD